MLETPENNPRSLLQVTLGFILGILVSLGCLLFSILLGAALGLHHAWMFPLLNATALVTSGMVALRKVHRSSYPEGMLIAISVAFLLNALYFAETLRGGYVE